MRQETYHLAPLQDDKGPGPFTSLCGRTVACFYTDPDDFIMMMSVTRTCPECAGLLEAAGVLIGVFSCKALLEFFAA